MQVLKKGIESIGIGHQLIIIEKIWGLSYKS